MAEEWLTLVDLAVRFKTSVYRLSALLRRRNLPYKWEDPPRPKHKARLLYEAGAVAAAIAAVRTPIRLTPEQKEEVAALAEMFDTIQKTKKAYDERRKALLDAAAISTTSLFHRINAQRRRNGNSQ